MKTDDMAELMAEHRKKNFALIVEPLHYHEHEGGVTLLVTGNGNAWQGVNLENKDEIRAVIDILRRQLD